MENFCLYSCYKDPCISFIILGQLSNIKINRPPTVLLNARYMMVATIEVNNNISVTLFREKTLFSLIKYKFELMVVFKLAYLYYFDCFISYNSHLIPL